MDPARGTSNQRPGLEPHIRPSPSYSRTPPQVPAQGGSLLPTGASTGSGTSSSAPRIRRRNRMITSCLECRRRKLKCDKSHPCTNCVKSNRDCVFLAPALDQASQLKLTEIKEKVGSLERLLERDIAKSSASTATAPHLERAVPDDVEDGLPPNEDEKDLEPTPLATVDAAFEIDGEDDDLLDLGVQLGKMRITERIGGFVRPKITQELQSTIASRGHKGPGPGPLEPPPVPPPVTLPPASEWLKPGPAYIAPSSGFFFGTAVHQASLIDYLPSRLAADRLIKQYFLAVHHIAKVLHRPTFEREYDTFWDEVSLGIEPPPSVQTVVFAAMFSGVVSMDEADVIRDFGVSKASLVENFKLGTETALSRANFLRTTKIETLQGFVMYLIPLCRGEISRAHSVLVGAAIRMAECMGLHRDGETYGMSPLETNLRRLIWHQLCFLDIRTCEATGPRPIIRREDFDTRFPLNVDDIDLHASGDPPVTENRWTDATFSLIRMEINEMIRTIWVDRTRLERRKVTLTAVLSKIETFKANMAARYDHLMDDRIPVQKCARVVKALLLSRLLTMVLHRYHNSVASPMPDRLRKLMISGGIITLETAITLETSPDLRSWTWYSGALQQYHTAVLFLMEIVIYPDRKEAARIWPLLAYIFECDPSEDPVMQAQKVLSELQHKIAVYQSMRGMRVPVVMEKHVGQRAPPIPETDNKTAASQHPPPSTSREPLGPPQRIPEVPPSIGKAQVPEVAFAGVANQEVLWALPKHQSPEASSDSSSVVEKPKMPPVSGAGNDLMTEIDWDAFDALFPPDQQNDVLNQPGPQFLNMPGGMRRY
ncbi:hypothetical protein M430DRAFT_117037 [Amorphotheca resinae ATCC 22711]|uniref:Zn(2)-C6 fungal-type domain-containing protein n=1 Tax=Amorphotheca resinae ATCC 22711 TaxID=857342 RepID=A0A2T3B8D7_AMORE|nr:hypothetical protein M430DRAFT_117037 [Amorphotheca resinae ATCC 22711]PSS23149.1 hypothetical protein M430DRAFT_117037 [Amorphotheca resinae ATCC 22711]